MTADISTKPHTMTPKQARFVAAMLGGHTVRDAAKAAKVSERQAFEWVKLPTVTLPCARGWDWVPGRSRRAVCRRSE